MSHDANSDRTTPLATGVQTGVAVAHLLLQGAGELTRLAAETHATIARAPLPWRRDATAEAAHAPLPYQLVTRSFLYLARLAHGLLKQGSIPAGQRGLLAFSALNGVCGDKLVAWSSPLAQQMMLCDEEGQPLPDNWTAGRAGVVVFIHGLCLSEQEWQTPAHIEFVSELRLQGQAVAWLRYNSGLAITANGASLSELLQQHFSERGSPRLSLIGHSMGGLLIRSACHHAGENRLGWTSRLLQAAYLGSPHQGAPLERLGNALNNTLGYSPYSKPFMRLGNIRSQGIRDLRQGKVAEAEVSELLPTARHLLLAGNLANSSERHFLGDGMVPVRSALGQHVDAGRALDAPDVTRYELEALNHMAMLRDERVYDALRGWLRLPKPLLSVPMPLLPL